jgi:Xaa-Pro aminopeptidase
VAFYGLRDMGYSWAVLRELDRQLSDVEVVGEFEGDILMTARATKDPEEVARIESVGRLTCEIVDQTIEFIRSHRLSGDAFVKSDGSPLTIGDCKAEIRLAMSARNLAEEVDTIFSIGRDAAIPHNNGNDSDPITTGRTIVFDIFPQEKGGGYFFDMTRTFCFGDAPEEVREHYRQLEDCFDTVSGQLKVGEKASVYQTMTCDFFEDLGHETLRTNPQVTSGYVHSLGHGIGLQVHERPRLADFVGNEDVLKPGHVFTFEPGLYYPDRGFGLRIEDVMYVEPSGTIRNLTNFRRDLVVEI